MRQTPDGGFSKTLLVGGLLINNTSYSNAALANAINIGAMTVVTTCKFYEHSIISGTKPTDNLKAKELPMTSQP